MKIVTWEFVRDADGTYSVFCDGERLGQSITEKWFAEEICVRWGFCGSEYVEINRQIQIAGLATLRLTY
jgi:hypothetical protein